MRQEQAEADFLALVAAVRLEVFVKGPVALVRGLHEQRDRLLAARVLDDAIQELRVRLLVAQRVIGRQDPLMMMIADGRLMDGCE